MAKYDRIYSYMIRKDDKMKKTNAEKPKTHRVTTTLLDEEFKVLQYWADRNQVSINDYIHESIDLAIRHENGDYDLPTLEVARLNQLIDTITVLSSNVQSLERIVISGFDSLLGLTRGDNYLLENEDGEI